MDTYIIPIAKTPNQAFSVNCGDDVLYIELRTLNKNEISISITINDVIIFQGLKAYSNYNFLADFVYLLNNPNKQLIFANNLNGNTITYDLLDKVELCYVME